MMKEKVAAVFFFCFGMAVLFGCGISKAQYKKAIDEGKQLQSSLDDEKKARADADEKIKKFETQVKELTDKVASLEKGKADAEKLVKDLNDGLAQKQQIVGNLTAQVEDLQATQKKLVESKRNLEAAKKILEESKKKLEEKTAEYDNLTKMLKDEVDKGNVELTELRGKMTVKLDEKVLFKSGKSKLEEAGKEALRSVAAALKKLPDKAIRVEGHTDNVPLGEKSPFNSNFELSVKRALSVVMAFQKEGIDPTRLSAEGYGEFQPRCPANDTPECKAKNRRIEIVLVPMEARSKGAEVVPAKK